MLLSVTCSLQASLEALSAAKAAVDEGKGLTLEDISRTVQDINTAINNRKTELAPRVKELRTARQTAQVRILPNPCHGRFCEHLYGDLCGVYLSTSNSTKGAPAIFGCKHLLKKLAGCPKATCMDKLACAAPRS